MTKSWFELMPLWVPPALSGMGALAMWYFSYHPRQLLKWFPPDYGPYDDQGIPRALNSIECQRVRWVALTFAFLSAIFAAISLWGVSP